MAKDVTVEVSKKGDFVVTIPAFKTPKESGSGKSLVVAGTQGVQYVDVKVNGKTKTLGVNVNVFEPKKKKARKDEDE